MTDQPPPPTEKKPRRPAAARKRAGRRVAAKKETPDAAAVENAGVVDVVASVSVEAAPPVEPSADVAAVLDPRPLAEPGSRGDAPATDAPSAPESVARSDEPAPKPATAPVETARSDAAPAQAAPAPAAAAERSDASPVADAKPDVPAEKSAAAAPNPAPIQRQASLRPGELIRVPLSVRWRDLDAFNHVNNSKYLSYLEEARLRWMLSVPGMGMDDNVAPVVAASNLSYRRPIGWPGDIVVELFVERIGGSSLTIGHRIVDSKDGNVLYCDGNVVMVWIDRNTGRSAPLPEDVRAACR